MPMRAKIKGKGEVREVWIGKRLVGRIERRQHVVTTRETDSEGRSFTKRKVGVRWRAWDPAGAALGELPSMAAWRRWFERRATRKVAS